MGSLSLRAPSPVDLGHLVRACTVLYQQQKATDAKLHANLRKIDFSFTHEFFLQVCNRFPLSWRPVYRFFMFSLTQDAFYHSSVTYNKILDVYGKSRNMDLLWSFAQQTAEKKFATDSTFKIVVSALSAAREMKKCVEFFHLMNDNGFGYREEVLNKVVEVLCRSKMVEEAKYIVWKMRQNIRPSETTYGILISGFCSRGDLVEACKIWNLMVEGGLQPEVDSAEKIIERFLKTDRFEDGMSFFTTIRWKRFGDLGLPLYKLLVVWTCKKGRLVHAFMLFNEMIKRGLGEDDPKVLSSIIYGLLSKGRAREARMAFEQIKDPDLGVYNDFIKGLLRLRRTREATQVLRLMYQRRHKPNMHTYIMLLQGHLGKKGRKGPHPEVNFDSIFVGGLVKVGKALEATKYVERMTNGGIEVPRFDYNKFLHDFSNEEGVVMFQEVGRRLKEAGQVDLGDIFLMYGERMATRYRRITT